MNETLPQKHSNGSGNKATRNNTKKNGNAPKNEKKKSKRNANFMFFGKFWFKFKKK